MIIVLNNKSNLDKKEFNEYLDELSKINTNHQIVLCPSFINIDSIDINNVEVGAQNVSSFEEGAYTGEVAASQLKSYNVKYALVGHSERRAYEQETYADINHKIKELLESNIIPILCVGETKKEKDNNLLEEVLEKQITSALEGLSNEERGKVIIAYEPRWAIGSGTTPTTEEIEEVISIIKRLDTNCKILYGGSANESNIDELRKINSLDGYLLGSLSLKVENLKNFLEKLN